MKNKRTYRFARVARGYDVQAVENYLDAEKTRNDALVHELRERISLLNAQCDELKLQNSELKGREEQIKSAFVTANENAKKLLLEASARYKLEMDRLQLFRAKWIGAYEQLKERYHFDKDALNMESVAIATELELRKQLKQDFSLNDGDGDEMENYFHSEVLRLATQPQAKIEGEESSAVKDLREKLKEADAKLGQRKSSKESAAFSYEEAANPTDSLEELCKMLGIKGAE